MSKGLVAKISLAVIGFLGSIVFARTLGPVGYGAFSVLVSVANILDNPVRGLGTACQKYIAEEGRSDGEILTIGLVGTTVLGGIVVAGLLIVGPRINYFDIENGPYYVAVVFVGLIFFKTLQPMVSGQGKFGTAVFLDSLRSLFTIPLQVALVLLGWGVGGMIYGLTAASLLTVPFSLRVLGVRPQLPSKQTVEDILSYSKYSISSSFVGSAYGQLDILLLGAVIGSGASGQYRIALQLALPGALLSMVMGSGLLAEVSSLASRGEEVAQQVTNNVSFTSLFAIPLFFGALAMPESIIVTVFGEAYRDAVPLLIGLAVYQILKTQSVQISSVLEGFGRPDLMLYLSTVTLVVNLGLGVLLIFQMGALGVVLATIVAEGTKLVLMTYYARREIPYNPFPPAIRYQVVAGVGMFLIIDLLHGFWGVSSWFELLGLVGVGAVLYGLFLVSLSDIFMDTARTIISDAQEQYLGR
ncbi:polysaccharide biosynthesis C-terminal domain-containing protein [Halobaculum sp. CBA1158]|uniref:oligosaccharide flippase family protein n=1 Tax=Halobaculum sp. CBA1158 TaxID=2904243 RepID=UPI001F3F9185|nr:polysaccharide biosynthesis C-terminal domain-containing protein [Halobaculum sp. CBA1158]UIP01056.1 polysaccharide biosynthesis C-terminal domain-containing protein [Halobaculum sp. CBA1158]